MFWGIMSPKWFECQVRFLLCALTHFNFFLMPSKLTRLLSWSFKLHHHEYCKIFVFFGVVLPSLFQLIDILSTLLPRAGLIFIWYSSSLLACLHWVPLLSLLLHVISSLMYFPSSASVWNNLSCTAVYLVAQYARYEIRRMEAVIEILLLWFFFWGHLQIFVAINQL